MKTNISRQGYVIRNWNTGFIIIKLFPTFPNFYKSDDRSILKLSVVGQGRWYLFGKVELFLATLQLASPCNYCGQTQNSGPRQVLEIWYCEIVILRYHLIFIIVPVWKRGLWDKIRKFLNVKLSSLSWQCCLLPPARRANFPLNVDPSPASVKRSTRSRWYLYFRLRSTRSAWQI